MTTRPRAVLSVGAAVLAILWALPFVSSSTHAGETAEAGAERSESYGAAIELSEATPLAVVLAAPERFADHKILIRGTISDVCQKKGCWTVLQDGSAHVRVRFEDYGFFLPKDSMGNQAYAEGRVHVTVLSEKEARHYEAESKNGDPSKIEGPQRSVGFMASGVRIVY